MTAIKSSVEAGPSDIHYFPSRHFPANLLHTIDNNNPLPSSPIEHIEGIATDGKLKTRYTVAFRADGIGGDETAIVGKGGLWTTKEVYSELADAMAARGRVVVWADTPVHGLREDEKRKGHDSASVQVDSLLSVMDAVRIPVINDKFHLWGHSFGGRVVAGAAAEIPNQVESVILFETLLGCTRSELLKRVPGYGTRNLLPTVMRQARRGNIDTARQIALKFLNGLGELARQGWEVSGEHVEPYTERMETAGTKYSVTSGDIDPFLPTHEQLQAMERAAVSEIIHGGHNYPIDYPLETAAITMHHIAALRQNSSSAA